MNVNANEFFILPDPASVVEEVKGDPAQQMAERAQHRQMAA